MANELALYDKIPNPMDAARQLGEWVHKSQLFGTACTEQANVIALECLARGVPPMDLANTYHVIGNKLSMKADAMAGRFQKLGGKIKVVERSGKRAAVEVYYEGVTTSFSYTADEALSEPSTYNYAKKDENDVVEAIGDSSKRKKLIDTKRMAIKPKYATERSLMQMLWARVISDAIRTVCPMVNAGTYAPEDFGTSVDDGDVVDVEIVKPEPKRTETSSSESKPEKTANPKEEPVTSASKEEKPPVDTREQPCSAEQIVRIKELWISLACTKDQIDAMLKKREVNAVKSLTSAQADMLIGNLEKALAKVKTDAPAEEAKPQSDKPLEESPGQFATAGSPASVESTATSVRAESRASEEAVNRVKGLLIDLKKTGAEGERSFEEVKNFLNGMGKRLGDLSVSGLQTFTSALMAKNLVAFFDFALNNPGAWSQADAGQAGK